MSRLGDAIEARAVAVAGLTALIGVNPTRLAPVAVRQGWNPPYVTYTVVSDPPVHVMVADQESQARVQFDVFGANWDEVQDVRDQLLAAFDRWSGLFGGTTVLASICESRGLMVEPDEPSLLPRLTVEFIMTYLT